MRVRALILHVPTGERRMYEESYEVEDVEGVDYQWTDGNFGCDCNRALFFARAAEEEDPEDLPCGTDRYRVRVFYGDSIVVDEIPTTAV